MLIRLPVSEGSYLSTAIAPVTKSRVGRRSKDPTDVIRIKADLARKLSQVCTRRGTSSPDFLDPVIRPFIEAEYRKMAQEIAEELNSEEQPEPRRRQK